MITDPLLAATTMRGPPECQPHHSTIETSIALFLCFGLVVSYLPQIVRIILKRSSLGFSPWFLFLGATSSASSFLNVVSLQWSIISCCKWMSTGACAESLLGVVQVGLQWLLFIIVLLLFLIYYPQELRYERSIVLQGDDNQLLAYNDDSSDSSGDLDSIDSHIAENYSGVIPSAAVEGAATSGVTSNGNEESPGTSGLASRVTIDEGDERSSSAFSRLVPTFWPVWKAPKKYSPSPLSKVSGDGERHSAEDTEEFPSATDDQGPLSPSGDVSEDRDTSHRPEQHVRLDIPAGLRRRRKVKRQSAEWSLALSLAWLVAFHFVFILSVTLLLVFSLPPSSFPDPPHEWVALGPSSRLLVTRWATFLGWSAMILAALQYLPQIVHTAKKRLVGSLSIPMMCLQVPGSALFVYSLSLRPGVNYTSLAAYACTGVLQAILLGLCISWRIREHRLGIDDFGRPLQEAGRRTIDQDA